MVSDPAVAGRIDAPGTAEETWASWPQLGRLPIADYAGWRSAVVVAAHPDDEVLGAGGLISMLAAAGARLRLAAVTDGEASHPGIAGPADLAVRRVAETAAALRVLGAEAADVVRLGLPDTGLAAREQDIAAVLPGLTAGYDICLAPWEGDAHADHEAVGRAARRAAPQTFFYPVWMWHWAQPGDRRVPWGSALRIPLTPAVAARKQAAIGCYASQLEPRPGGAGPVLTAATVAHFSRGQEVIFPVPEQ